jgi:hypothetical protein
MKLRSLIHALLFAVSGIGGAEALPLAADLHRPFSLLLQHHVEAGVVDYAALKGETDDLDRYLDTLAAVDLSGADREHKLAFYINAYNACTLRLIVRHFPEVKSIRDLRRPWKTREWDLAGVTLSLDDIEHKVLRAELAEPRIHFAIVCASISCPKLASRAYAAEDIDAELALATDAFIRSPENVQVEIRGGLFGDRPVLRLSKIFDWFSEDFVAAPGGSVVDFIRAHATPEVEAFIDAHRQRLKVDHLAYDWHLNGKQGVE